MENIIFNLSELHNHGTAFFDYLALRKYFFVDTLGWDIPHNDNFEMDQYDNPLASYSLVLKNGKVIGGSRVMPTTSSWGEYSYMLKDAINGKLADIPSGVLDEEIKTPKVWECTRLVISDQITNQAERSKCLALIVDGLVNLAKQGGGEELVSLSPVLLMRTLRQLGYAASRIGEPYFNPGDGRKYAVLSMPAIRTPGFAVPTPKTSNRQMAVQKALEIRETA
ncbi:MAG TPA: autoinducer synthase [Rhodobacteraceae bacterium]|jgi:acyl homoserine lactone synthase|nr:autoinducer synthase [Paracoccaceae bacterium]